MALLRFGRGWSASRLRSHLEQLRQTPKNFQVDGFESLREDEGWASERATWHIGWEQPGRPEPAGIFERLEAAVADFAFSDPRIVQAYFDPDEPLLGRTMVLELKALGLHFLCGARVSEVVNTHQGGTSCWGYRYDTLQGHIERGMEWFRVTKDHASGEVGFGIESRWKPGDFPNWWTRRGFDWVGGHYRIRWMERAPIRLQSLCGPTCATTEPALMEFEPGPDLA